LATGQRGKVENLIHILRFADLLAPVVKIWRLKEKTQNLVTLVFFFWQKVLSYALHWIIFLGS
jgi:hypothetical protein